MALKLGIVGLPNVGKSTIFNALTGSMMAQTANYPFCTIEPNVSSVDVPDPRLHRFVITEGSEVMVHSKIDFVDIAGLVKGASKGEGLGNKFLSHIRNVDGVLYMLRCFDDQDIIHVSGTVDPVVDAEIIRLELAIADITSLENRIPTWEKKAKNDVDFARYLHLAKKILGILQAGSDLSEVISLENKKDLDFLQLLSTKKFMYVSNVGEKDVLQGNEYVKKVEDMAAREGVPHVMISAKIESEIAVLQDSEKKAFLTEYGLEQSGLDRIITQGYKMLGLATYFTVGKKEARAWTINTGDTAYDAAEVIHTDFAKGFICAEVVRYDDYLRSGDIKVAKENGMMALRGKDYKVEEGDIIYFRFNVSK